MTEVRADTAPEGENATPADDVSSEAAVGGGDAGLEVPGALPPGSRRGFWGVVVATVVALAMCAGVGNWLMHAVMDADAERWIKEFRDHPQVRESLGGIDSGGYALTSTLKEQDEETVVYFVNGPRGSGELVVTEFGMRIPHVELRSQGKSWVLQSGVAGPKTESHE